MPLPPLTGHLAQELPVVYADIEAAAQRLQGQANQTPVFTSRTVDERTQSQVFFKCENFQRTGSFKFRGAFNAMTQLSPTQKQQGVLAYSSGNHAQAIALCGKLLGIPTTIIMPSDSPTVKQAATKEYGAEIILYDRATADREVLTSQLAAKKGYTIIPPFDAPAVIAGQGTATKELIEEVGSLDYLLVCCGGGGLLSGSAIAAHSLSPNCKVIGVEPTAGDDAARSFHTKTLQTVTNPNTIADGARTPSLGSITFPLIMHYVHDMVTVTDEALLKTIKFFWERMKLLIEPKGALGAAALLEHVIYEPNKRIGVIVSGGNVDINQMSSLIKGLE